MFTYAVTDAAIAHAIAEYPKEAAGAVVAGTYVPLVNSSPTPSETFAVPADIQVTYGDSLQAIIHSHCEGWPVPSEADMQQQQAMALPWGITAVNKDKGGHPSATAIVWFGDQAPRQPLVGRSFIHGHQDCWSVIRDWHAEKGILLEDPPRDWEWWLDDKSLYTERLPAAGFVPVEGPEFGAIFIVAIGKRRITARDERGQEYTVRTVENETPNHAGIYLGNQQILHHVARKSPYDPATLSARQPLGYWGPYFNVPPIWMKHRDLK